MTNLTVKCFTGQPFIGNPDDENVECAACKGRINLRYGAWFDRYNQTYDPSGCYVHYKCISAARKQELELEIA